MLETIREYGLEALEASGKMEMTQHAHAAYYLVLAEQAEPELAGPRPAVWFAQLEREHDNLRATLQWLLDRGEREQALRLGSALSRRHFARCPGRFPLQARRVSRAQELI